MVYLFLFILLVAAIYDGLTREIPLWLFMTAFVGKTIDILFFSDNKWIYIGMGCLAFFLTLLAAYFHMIGGADALYFGLCGYYLGIYWLYVMFLACLLSLPHAIRKRNGYPLVPYIFVGALLVVLVNLIGGMKWF